MNPSPTTTHYMRETLALAASVLPLGEFPIAALLVLDDQVIASATTAEKRQGRFLIHAELLALEAADRQRLSFNERQQACLYTNLEPCLMCMGAAMSFFLGEIVYALESPGDGAVSLVRNWVRTSDDFPGYRIPKITGEILRLESQELFKIYVKQQPPGPMRDWAESLTRL
jgi:tRNA(adenine34) deaminase